MNNIEIKNIDSYLEDYISKSDFDDDSINRMNAADFLILPLSYNDEYFFHYEATHFFKFCREMHPEVTIDFMAKDINRIVQFRSFDIWLPIVQVVNPVLVPVLVNIVSNYIWEQIKGREHEEVKVDFKVIIKNGDKSKEIHYNGDAKTFKETFGKIDVNKIMED